MTEILKDNQGNQIKASGPNIAEFIRELTELDPSNLEFSLQSALEAEVRKAYNSDLETVINTLVGLKLIDPNCNELEIFKSALMGSERDQQLVKGAEQAVSEHDKSVRARKKAENKAFGAIVDGEFLDWKGFSLVHATNYLPRVGESGQVSISELYSATGQPRSTIHTSMNHLVESNFRSSDIWEQMQFVVISPMEQTVELNGEPTGYVGHDTWFEVRPQRGLVLPDGTIIVAPESKTLPPGIPQVITYKDTGFTEDDIKQLLAEAPDYELATILGSGVLTFIDAEITIGGRAYTSPVTKMTPDDRVASENKFMKLTQDQHIMDDLCARLARMLSVRKALNQQNTKVIESLTILEGDFRSEELTDAWRDSARAKGGSGLHSDSIVGRCERTLVSWQEGRITLEVAKECIHEDSSYLSVGTLQMAYRLGVL